MNRINSYYMNLKHVVRFKVYNILKRTNELYSCFLNIDSPNYDFRKQKTYLDS